MSGERKAGEAKPGGVSLRHERYLIEVFSRLTAAAREGGHVAALRAHRDEESSVHRLEVLPGIQFSFLRRGAGRESFSGSEAGRAQGCLRLFSLLKGSLTLELNAGASLMLRAGESLLLSPQGAGTEIVSLSYDRAQIAMLAMDLHPLKQILPYRLRAEWDTQLRSVLQGADSLFLVRTRAASESLTQLTELLRRDHVLYKEKQLILRWAEEHLMFLARYRGRRESLLCRALLQYADQKIQTGKMPRNEELEFRFGHSRYRLQKMLAQAGYRGIKETLLEMRLVHAAQRLRRGEEALQEIARSLGFANPAKFSQQFRARYRMSPRNYRKRANEDADES